MHDRLSFPFFITVLSADVVGVCGVRAAFDPKKVMYVHISNDQNRMWYSITPPPKKKTTEQKPLFFSPVSIPFFFKDCARYDGSSLPSLPLFHPFPQQQQ
mmetsp:Transcript_21508/g.38922  ORF Transcript_21508/g.38922 Transcript_21508/m.38922 type:complete len:100 (-) Transcript_21508:11-310(-)